MTTKSPDQLTAELDQFTGDLQRFKTLSPTLIYTPGVQYLAEQAECYWLIDAIASYVPSRELHRAVRRHAYIESFHSWDLVVKEDQSAILSARVDSGDPPFIQQHLEFTDFPLERIDLWCGFDGRYWTLYLPSEH